LPISLFVRVSLRCCWCSMSSSSFLRTIPQLGISLPRLGSLGAAVPAVVGTMRWHRALLSSSPRSALPPMRWRPSALPGSWGTCCARALLSDSGETSVPNLEGVRTRGVAVCRRLSPLAGASILARTLSTQPRGTSVRPCTLTRLAHCQFDCPVCMCFTCGLREEDGLEACWGNLARNIWQ
jgi:hypothetical protein